jgi:plastocyanin
MTKRITVLAVCLALALAACGSEEKSVDTTPAAPGTTEPATTATTQSAAGDVVEVDMKDIKYVPDNVTAKVGQTIRWKNSDPVAHTVDAESAGVESGTIDPGKTFETKFDKAGKVDYVCAIHPNQTGTVTVQ